MGDAIFWVYAGNEFVEAGGGFVGVGAGAAGAERVEMLLRVAADGEGGAADGEGDGEFFWEVTWRLMWMMEGAEESTASRRRLRGLRWGALKYGLRMEMGKRALRLTLVFRALVFRVPLCEFLD